MVSWALCSARSSIMDGKSDTVTAVASRGSQRERQSERRREGIILFSLSGKVGDSVQHRHDIHKDTCTNAHIHTSPLSLLLELNMPWK